MRSPPSLNPLSGTPGGCGAAASNELLSNPDYQALCGKILARKKEGFKILGSRRLVGSLLKGKPIHCHPALKPHIDHDGCLVWPCKALSNLNPVKVNVLDYASLDAAYKAAAKIICPNDILGNGPGQCGADCNWLQNFVSDIYARSLVNPLTSGLPAEILEFLGAV